MDVIIRDKNALKAVSPEALSAYARLAGWTRTESYRGYSDIYVAERRPEIIIPRSRHLGDYASTVLTLIEVFAEVAGQDTLAIYRDLLTADRDVVRVRATDADDDGSLPVAVGMDLLRGARDMILAAARTVDDQQPNRSADDFLRRLRLGQTEYGSFVITLLGPALSPQANFSQVAERPGSGDPVERQVTRRLVEALGAVRGAVDDVASGDTEAFWRMVDRGVSANLCKALAGMTRTLEQIDVSLVWARTYPMEDPQSTVRFASDDAPVLRDVARTLQDHEPTLGVKLVGRVQRLERGRTESGGTVTLRASVDGRRLSVATSLRSQGYRLAIQAHETRSNVVIRGDLKRVGQRWHLLNASIEDVIATDETPEDAH